jgi:hypothetical protein
MAKYAETMKGLAQVQANRPLWIYKSESLPADRSTVETSKKSEDEYRRLRSEFEKLAVQSGYESSLQIKR